LPIIWIELCILNLLLLPVFQGHPRASGGHSQGERRLFGRDPSKSSGVVGKISREETEKQTPRSRRAWEFSRSCAQENGKSKRANAKKTRGGDGRLDAANFIEKMGLAPATQRLYVAIRTSIAEGGVAGWTASL
jgi:hypothetical protein